MVFFVKVKYEGNERKITFIADSIKDACEKVGQKIILEYDDILSDDDCDILDSLDLNNYSESISEISNIDISEIMEEEKEEIDSPNNYKKREPSKINYKLD